MRKIKNVIPQKLKCEDDLNGHQKILSFMDM